MRFLLFLIVLSFSSCYEVKRNCKAFKTGHFQSKITLDNRVLESTFIRYDTLQVEFFNGKT
ncbi:MAG: DNA topoisomerase IV, partial [Bacteroidota bacterium]|nr:DNA topoisomerase IV [Bacteroidota bacterium]